MKKKPVKLVIEASKECLQGIGKSLKDKKIDFTVTAATIREIGSKKKPYIIIAWETKSAGFGELTLYKHDGKWFKDTEAMGNEFCAEVMKKLIESMQG